MGIKERKNKTYEKIKNKVLKNNIPFNIPFTTGKEIKFIKETQINGHLSSNGFFSQKCHQWLEQNTKTKKAMLTHSCSAALEMAALLLDIKSGDEIIMPSFTFVSTANAFVLRGATPVFVDIRADTLNIDEKKIKNAISKRTKAIVVVHYAGVACEMDTIMTVAKRYNISVIEDAAHATLAYYKNKVLGSIGTMGTYSFHETKNIISGEGGALLINNKKLIERAEIIREKGTNRNQFFLGKVDKYNWQDIGSSYSMNEITAAFLWSQLNASKKITNKRLKIWENYHKLFESLEKEKLIRRPIIPNNCKHNAHLYYVILSTKVNRKIILKKLRKINIEAVFHYYPLHLSPAGIKYGKISKDLKNTFHISKRLIRLPFWIGIKYSQQIFIVKNLKYIIKESI